MRIAPRSRLVPRDHHAVRRLFAMLAAALALATLAAPARGQRLELDSLPRVGELVRYRTWAADSTVIGTVMGKDGDQLFVRIESTYAVVKLDTRRLEHLEVSEGLHRHPAWGALIGLGAGAAIGNFGGVLSSVSLYGSSPEQEKKQRTGVAIGAVVGLVVGALVGYAFQTERWSQLIPLGQTALRVDPGPGRTTLSLSYAF